MNFFQSVFLKTVSLKQEETNQANLWWMVSCTRHIWKHLRPNRTGLFKKYDFCVCVSLKKNKLASFSPLKNTSPKFPLHKKRSFCAVVYFSPLPSRMSSLSPPFSCFPVKNTGWVLRGWVSVQSWIGHRWKKRKKKQNRKERKTLAGVQEARCVDDRGQDSVVLLIAGGGFIGAGKKNEAARRYEVCLLSRSLCEPASDPLFARPESDTAAPSTLPARGPVPAAYIVQCKRKLDLITASC